MKPSLTLLLPLLMLSSPLHAADGPEQIRWNCIDVGAAGLRWNSDTETYRDASFFMQQHQIVQQKGHLTFPATLGFQADYSCRFRPNIPVLTCEDGVRLFNLNVQTGYATHSKNYGWMDPYSPPPTMFVAAARCHRI